MLSATEVCQRTGASYRQVDYWCRSGVIEPWVGATGNGSRRVFSEYQVRVVRLIADLAALGAQAPVLRRAAVCAARIIDWTGIAFVDEDGNITYDPPGKSCWLVDLGACAKAVEHRRGQLTLV
jgi:hypothetical protein